MTRYERSKPSASGLINILPATISKESVRKRPEAYCREIYGEDPIDKILRVLAEQIPNLSRSIEKPLFAKLKIYGAEQILSKLF